MARTTPERWNVAETRQVIAEYLPALLETLDAATRKAGIDPTTATHAGLLNLGATVACLALVEHEGLTLRQAESGLTAATPTMVQRAIARGVQLPLERTEPEPRSDG